MAMVDIVIPTRNRFDLTVESVTSVQAQTMVDWTLTIVDDRSTDGSAEQLMERFSADPRISFIAGPGRGPEGAREAGFRAGSSPWVALLDSDDLWHPSKLEAQLSAGVDGVDTVLCWYTWFRPDGSIRKTGQLVGAGKVSPLLTDNMSMPLIRRDLLTRIGGFEQKGNEQLRASEGIDFYIRLLSQGNVTIVPEVLVRCRDHPGYRESAHLSTPESSLALDSVIESHSTVLSQWPEEYAQLLARAGARYIASGSRGPGYARLWRAVRTAPSPTRRRLLRRYAPFAIKNLVVPVFTRRQR